MRNTADVICKPFAVLLQSISGVSAINPIVAFYDIHGRKREVLFFYFVPDTTRNFDYYVLITHLMFPDLLLYLLLISGNQFQGFDLSFRGAEPLKQRL
jgi:hypothetical protein